MENVTFHYKQELTLRIQEYIFEQFLESILETNPKETSLAHTVRKAGLTEEEFIKIGMKERKAFDLGQLDEIIDLEVIVPKPMVILKARNTMA